MVAEVAVEQIANAVREDKRGGEGGAAKERQWLEMQNAEGDNERNKEDSKSKKCPNDPETSCLDHLRH